MEGKHYWAIALENSIITICFAAVAIYTNSWWVVLFSIIGWTTVRYHNKENKDAKQQQE